MSAGSGVLRSLNRGYFILVRAINILLTNIAELVINYWIIKYQKFTGIKSHIFIISQCLWVRSPGLEYPKGSKILVRPHSILELKVLLQLYLLGKTNK